MVSGSAMYMSTVERRPTVHMMLALIDAVTPVDSENMLNERFYSQRATDDMSHCMRPQVGSTETEGRLVFAGSWWWRD